MIPLHSTAPIRGKPWVTSLLIAANLGVFAWELVLLLVYQGGALEAFVERWGVVPARLLSGNAGPEEAWTLLTHQFLHGGLAHVAGNLWFLRVFGQSVEDRLGAFRFLMIYLASGVGAAAAQVATGPGSDLPMLGASGAIAGVLGAYLVVLPGTWVLALVPWIIPILPVPAFVFIALWFAMQLANGVGSIAAGTEGGIAWWAHAGGFVAGFVLASALARRRRRKTS
jgi:membrane associated rhomboid family serine protease